MRFELSGMPAELSETPAELLEMPAELLGTRAMASWTSIAEQLKSSSACPLGAIISASQKRQRRDAAQPRAKTAERSEPWATLPRAFSAWHFDSHL